MAGRKHHSGGIAAAQGRTRAHRRELSPRPKRGRTLVGGLVALGIVAVFVVADDEWAWRDTLRRMAHGEEVPAYRVNAWSDAQSVREKLADALLTSDLAPTVEDRATRRDLALHTLIVAAGDEVISRGEKEMGELMQELCLDVEWLEEMVCFCPMVDAPKALPMLAHIYHAEKKKMVGMPGNRRFASAIAFEFARAGLSREQALEAYRFYAAGGQKHWLNNHFSELSIWELRVIAARCTDAEWGNQVTLNWFQRNSRLPAQGYVTVGEALGARSHSLFGVAVDSPTFLALYRDASEGGTASMYEASGCSTAHDRALYAATAACANGVPALVASNDEAAVCLVDVNGRWESSAPVPELATCSWAFFGQNNPDFVKLAAALGGDMEKSLQSFRLTHMAQFLYESGNQPLAHTFFRKAVEQQPLNYAAWAGYHSCGASQEEMARGLKHFEQLPGVAAALSALMVK